MRVFCAIVCILAVLTVGCGNSANKEEAVTEESYSQKVGKDIGGSINDMTQKARDAAGAAQKNLDDTEEAADNSME